MKQTINLQDVFLNQVRKDHIQIRGQVKGFDNYTIIMDSDGKQQMIYKHAISTMIPAREINFMKKEDE